MLKSSQLFCVHGFNNMSVSSSRMDDKLRRSKSMCSLSDDPLLGKIQAMYRERRGFGYRNSASNSSVEVFIVNDSDSETSADGSLLASLEQKIDRLTDLFLEQCDLLSSLKDEILESRGALEKSGYMQNQLLTEILSQTITESMKDESPDCVEGEGWEGNMRARSLLRAIEVKRACSLDLAIQEALTEFLQSDELREHVVSATTASVREVVRAGVARDLAATYLPALQRAHRGLLRHVTATIGDAFADLENSCQMSKHVFRASRNLRRTLDRQTSFTDTSGSSNAKYVNSLRRTVEELLDKELIQWRQKVLDIITAELQPEQERAESPVPSLEYLDSPRSPPQPADPAMSRIDQLMNAAEINKLIADGDVNGAFEKALSASDLSLVMLACRAVDPAKLFAPPCPLTQSVLLSLAQQLATDMVHETQLKCRYLEEAIINLNMSNAATRAHLPVVVGEIRKHLMKFLLSYPKHVAGRRITLIIMAADNLLKHYN